MTAAASTHVTIADRVLNSNKCSLRISLIGIPQEMPLEIENTQDSVIKTLISDYVSLPCNYTVKVVFPIDNLQFNHLKMTIRPQESLIFITGQMEIIANEFYVYANDINYISTHFAIKNKEHVEVDNADDTEDNNVDDVEDHQPKTEEPGQVNQDSKTNYEDK
ncbi:hypothetical protein F8M41_003425 [Gigaspora margarita]|uniref:Uncharacterized protein n=1 Tax=Gigaspora margarita TaxID=4874 RepID=A0A8H4B4U4_GIGMA|nr:hypothetical protein F8M41_003425 [Gigaspora margarita]